MFTSFEDFGVYKHKVTEISWVYVLEFSSSQVQEFSNYHFLKNFEFLSYHRLEFSGSWVSEFLCSQILKLLDSLVLEFLNFIVLNQEYIYKDFLVTAISAWEPS